MRPSEKRLLASTCPAENKIMHAEFWLDADSKLWPKTKFDL